MYCVEIYCRALLKRQGDEPSDRDHYPDTLLFQPVELDKTFWSNRRAKSEPA